MKSTFNIGSRPGSSNPMLPGGPVILEASRKTDVVGIYINCFTYKQLSLFYKGKCLKMPHNPSKIKSELHLKRIAYRAVNTLYLAYKIH